MREVLERRREDLCHGQGVRDLEALVVRRVLLAARGRLLEERWLRRVERVVRVLAVRWSVREVLGRLREDSCHGQGVLVKVAPVAWSSSWVVSARLQAVRLISPAARPALALVATRK